MCGPVGMIGGIQEAYYLCRCEDGTVQVKLFHMRPEASWQDRELQTAETVEAARELLPKGLRKVPVDVKIDGPNVLEIWV